MQVAPLLATFTLFMLTCVCTFQRFVIMNIGIESAMALAMVHASALLLSRTSLAAVSVSKE